MKRYAALLIAIILLSLPLLLQAPPPALAANVETAVTAPTDIQAQPDSQDIPAEKIDRFAAAYLQVLQLLSDHESELPAAETSAEALKIQQSIEANAVALIKESGLTMPEYMEILSLASQDETFRDKVLGKLDESLTN